MTFKQLKVKLFPHALSRLATLAGVLILACGGCETVKDVSVKDIEKADAGVAGPGQRVTRNDFALEALGDMLQAYNSPPVRVQTLAINNATAGEVVPKDLAQIVSTALGKIQGPIKLIPYDPTYQVAEKELGKTLDRTLPDLLVKGAFTEFDKDMLEKKFEAEADYELPNGRAGLGVSHDRASSGGQVALDLQAVAYQTQQPIQGAQTSNKICLMKGENNTSLNLVVEGNGLGVKSTLARKDSIHAALRPLVEVSVLELVGKYCEVPYWRCIEGAPADQKVVESYRRSLEDDPNATARLKVLAFCHGEAIDLQNAELNRGEKEIVNKLKAKCGVTSDIDLSTQLWLTVPIAESAQRLKTYRRNMVRVAAEQEKAAAAAAHTGTGASINTGADLSDSKIKNSVLSVTTKGVNRDLTIKATDGSKVDTGIEARGSKIEGSKTGVNTSVDIVQATGGSKINTGVEANNSTIKGSKVNINTTTTDDIIAKDGSKINTVLIANGAKIEGSQLNANTVAGRIEATGGSEINSGISANNANIKDSKLNANTAVEQLKAEGGSKSNTGIKVDGTNAKVEDMTINVTTSAKSIEAKGGSTSNTGVITDGGSHSSNTKDPILNVDTTVNTTPTAVKPESDAGIADELREMDKALRSLGTGTLAFNTPDKMMLDETSLVHLVLDTTPKDVQLASLVCGPGQVVTAEAKYAPLVEARLVSDAFEITPVTETRQPVSAVAPTEWRWQVSAKQLGTRNLYLSIYAVITLKNERHERLLQTFERKLEVQVKFSNHPVTYLKNRPQFMFVGTSLGLLLAGGCLAYLRFARRVKASGGVWRVAECQQNTQVFVSYSRKDSAWALEFTEALRAKGFQVWMDVGGIAPATLWAEQIVIALTQAHMLVLVGSRHSFASRNVHKEVALAAEHQKTIVLLVIDDSDVPAALAYHLAGLQHIQTTSAEIAAEAVSKLPLLLLTPASSPSSPPTTAAR